MLSWKGHISRGTRFLSSHDVAEALKEFRSALEGCPIRNSGELSRIMYYIGICLYKLGIKNSAIKSWRTASKLRPFGYAAKMLRRSANEYGMVRQTNMYLDDWNAFYSIHLSRYLRNKKSRKIGSDAEKDMIAELICDYWRAMRQEYVLSALSYVEKLELFESIKIVFPFFDVPEDEIQEKNTKNSKIIEHNFDS